MRSDIWNSRTLPWRTAAAGLSLGIVFGGVVECVGAQDLTIVSPSAGVVVNTGTPLSVRIEQRSGSPAEWVELHLAPHGEVWGPVEGSGPWTLVGHLPPSRPGKTALQAYSIQGSEVLRSQVVEITARNTSPVENLAVFPPLTGMRVGDQALLTVQARIGGERVLLSGADTGTTYSIVSGSGVVAMVESNGLITATGAGRDAVRVENGTASIEVPVVVSLGSGTPTTTSTTTTTLPPPSAQRVSGKKLQLKDNADLSRKSFLAQSKDLSLDLGGGNGSADDPVVTSGSLVRVRTSSGCGGPCDTTYPLTATWGYIGKPGENKGYKFKATTGPIGSVTVKAGRLLKITGKGALGHALTSDPQPVDVVLQLGSGQRYCMRFGGQTTFKPSSNGATFQAKDAPAPAACPP